jgi:hypothetical protein
MTGQAYPGVDFSRYASSIPRPLKDHDPIADQIGACTASV